MDTFENCNLTPGVETLIRTPNDGVVLGIVASVDEDARSVLFADGRVYQFPEEQEVGQ